MIKGIVGHGYADELIVPIIENTAREYELTDSLAAAVCAPSPHHPPMAPSLSYTSPPPVRRWKPTLPRQLSLCATMACTCGATTGFKRRRRWGCVSNDWRGSGSACSCE